VDLAEPPHELAPLGARRRHQPRSRLLQRRDQRGRRKLAGHEVDEVGVGLPGDRGVHEGLERGPAPRHEEIVGARLLVAFEARHQDAPDEGAPLGELPTQALVGKGHAFLLHPVGIEADEDWPVMPVPTSKIAVERLLRRFEPRGGVAEHVGAGQADGGEPLLAQLERLLLALGHEDGAGDVLAERRDGRRDVWVEGQPLLDPLLERVLVLLAGAADPRGVHAEPRVGERPLADLHPGLRVGEDEPGQAGRVAEGLGLLLVHRAEARGLHRGVEQARRAEVLAVLGAED